jgi:hypothetical protein
MEVTVKSNRTTTTAAMTNSQMTVPVADKSWTPPYPFFIAVEGEIIRVCSQTGNDLNVCPTGQGRNAQGTNNKAHVSGLDVFLWDQKTISPDSVASLRNWAAALESGPPDANGNPTSKPRYRDDVQAFVKQLKPWFQQFINETPGGALATAQAAVSAAQSTLDAARANAEP